MSAPSRHRKAVSLGGGRSVQALPAGAADATRERLAKAMADGQVLVDQGTRSLADPFDALRNRQILDRRDRGRNGLLWEAGMRFRRHWDGGRLDGLTAFDFGRECVDGGRGPQGLTPTEAATRHRTAYRKASAAVGGRLLPYLAGVVIDGHPAGALCHLVSDTAHPRTAEALVVERLREALYRLAEHWGMEPGGSAGPSGSAGQHLARVEQV